MHTLVVNGYFGDDIIKRKYYRILHDYLENPTFKDNSRGLDSLKKRKTVDECLSELRDCVRAKEDFQYVLHVEMTIFKRELVERGLNPKEVYTLSSVYTYWARYFHFFTYLNYNMYSPRAHYISILVQQLELYHLYTEMLNIELLEAQYISLKSRREPFFNVIIEKRKLLAEDIQFHKRLEEELPELPLYGKMEKYQLEYVINRIKEVLDPTFEAEGNGS